MGVEREKKISINFFYNFFIENVVHLKRNEKMCEKRKISTRHKNRAFGLERIFAVKFIKI
jgi:hypothetical protein